MALDRHAAAANGEAKPPRHDEAVADALSKAAADLSMPSSLERLSDLFTLSAFERDVLLLCAGMELDAGFAARCAAAQHDTHHPYPTLRLALEALPGGHWSCLSPSGPLRYWRLIELGGGGSIRQSSLKIDERILHYLTGLQYLDERLDDFVRPVGRNEDLVQTFRDLAKRIAGSWSGLARSVPVPVVQLRGNDIASLREIAAEACAQAGLGLYEMFASHTPLDPRELGSLTRLWEREAILSNSALLLDCSEIDGLDASRVNAVNHFIHAVGSPLIVGGDLQCRSSSRPVVTLEVSQPTRSECRILWHNALGEAVSSLDGDLDSIISQYRLSASSISAVAADALGQQSSHDDSGPNHNGNLGKLLSEACRAQGRSRMGHLAQRIEPMARWDDLVLPEIQIKVLREIAIHVRQRLKVYEDWGFAKKHSRGLGISSLFAGPSGTGKTMAAEVLANELSLDLFRIDLSQVVSKYIGETEKNLRKVFDAAEESGAVLLFDEADALFGKRSEVKDSHDRYANIEISYLLQRMEAYHGLAVLTTNMKNAIDDAFRRRIRFIVDFPFPDATQRFEIWRRAFPHDTPTDRLDIGKLACLNLAGGSICGMAMNAAFLAAEEDQPVRMSHMLRAARSEYTKLGRTLSQSEVRGWA